MHSSIHSQATKLTMQTDLLVAFGIINKIPLTWISLKAKHIWSDRQLYQVGEKYFLWVVKVLESTLYVLQGLNWCFGSKQYCMYQCSKPTSCFSPSFCKNQSTLAWSERGTHSSKVLLLSTPYTSLSSALCHCSSMHKHIKDSERCQGTAVTFH